MYCFRLGRVVIEEDWVGGRSGLGLNRSQGMGVVGLAGSVPESGLGGVIPLGG